MNRTARLTARRPGRTIAGRCLLVAAFVSLALWALVAWLFAFISRVVEEL